MLYLPLHILVKWIIFLKNKKNKKSSNSDETGPEERTREGDHRLKV